MSRKQIRANPVPIAPVLLGGAAAVYASYWLLKKTGTFSGLGAPLLSPTVTSSLASKLKKPAGIAGSLLLAYYFIFPAIKLAAPALSAGSSIYGFVKKKKDER